MGIIDESCGYPAQRKLVFIRDFGFKWPRVDPGDVENWLVDLTKVQRHSPNDCFSLIIIQTFKTFERKYMS